MYATRLSAASTYKINRADHFLGISLAPAAGGTVVVADLANLGANPDHNNPPAGTLFKWYWATAAAVQVLALPAVRTSNGLSISFTSTTEITVFHD